MVFVPRFTITAKIANNLMRISEDLTRANLGSDGGIALRLRRSNRLRSVHSSLSIEGNTLSLDEVTSVIDGKALTGPADEMTEVRNAYSAYESMDSFDPYDKGDLLKAHRMMMDGLTVTAGSFRKGEEAVIDADGNIVHLAPHPGEVPDMIGDLLYWTEHSDYPMIVRSCVFHYQLEYIHPFEDGNGRIGRLWQTLLLSGYDEAFRWVPVESMIRAYQNEYYAVLKQSNEDCDCTSFLVFMTDMILKALEQAIGDPAGIGTDIGHGLSSKSLAVYGLIRDGLFIDIGQAARVLGVSRPTLNRCLRSLKDEGLIVKEGNRKTGVWKVSRK